MDKSIIEEKKPEQSIAMEILYSKVPQTPAEESRAREEPITKQSGLQKHENKSMD